MDWILKAANERNAVQTRAAAITRAAPALWRNICDTIGQAVRFYGELPFPIPGG